jgi:hypothetical protein
MISLKSKEVVQLVITQCALNESLLKSWHNLYKSGKLQVIEDNQHYSTKSGYYNFKCINVVLRIATATLTIQCHSYKLDNTVCYDIIIKY